MEAIVAPPEVTVTPAEDAPRKMCDYCGTGIDRHRKYMCDSCYDAILLIRAAEEEVAKKRRYREMIERYRHG